MDVHTDHGEACPRLSSPCGPRPQSPPPRLSSLSQIPLPLCQPTRRSAATRQHTPRVHLGSYVSIRPTDCAPAPRHVRVHAPWQHACYSPAQLRNQSGQQIAPQIGQRLLQSAQIEKSITYSPSIKEPGRGFHGEHLRTAGAAQNHKTGRQAASD